MQLSIWATFLLAYFAATAAAGLSTTTRTRTFCRTALVGTQGSTVTSTKSTLLSRTRTVTSTVTPTVTVTPSSATITTTSTSTLVTTTTLPQSTDTFKTTLTSTNSVTSIATALVTTTTTTTSTVSGTYSTLTVSPSSGFVPIASALAAQGYTASKKFKRFFKNRLNGVERSPLENRAASSIAVSLDFSTGQEVFSPPQWPGAVTCMAFIEVLITNTAVSTAKTTSTVTAAQGTVIQSVVSTTTSTVTVTPIAASTTVTATTQTTTTISSTTTQTVTSTITSTTTSYAPQSTYYAACASNNVVSYVNNQRIYNVLSSGFSYGNNSADAYSCCAQCVQLQNCGGTAFNPNTGNCYLFPLGGSGSGICSPTQSSGTYYSQTGSRLGYQVSDSNCGEVTYGGGSA